MQRWLRMDFLDVAHDGWYFADRCAVLEHQGGDHSTRVDRAIGLGMLLALSKVDWNHGDRQSLLSDENTHAPRIGRACGLVELDRFVSHVKSPSLLIKVSVRGSELRAAVDAQGVAGNPAGFVGREEGDCSSNVIGRGHAFERLD